MENEQEKTKKIELGFGDVFEYYFEGRKYEYVVIDPTDSKYFSVMALTREPGGEIKIAYIAGTSSPSLIDCKTGETLTYDEIIEGIKRFLDKEDVEDLLTESYLELLKEYSLKQPLVLEK